MRNAPVQAIAALSAGSDHNSVAIPASQAFAVSAQAIVAGATGPAGTVKLQYSNDSANSQPGSVVNWSDIPSATVSTNSNAVFAIANTSICYQWIRASYTASTTTGGTVTVNLSVQGV